jgi:hypothetical protein
VLPLRTLVWRVDDRLVVAMSIVERDAPVLADAAFDPSEEPSTGQRSRLKSSTACLHRSGAVSGKPVQIGS